MKYKINWWRTSFGRAEIRRVVKSIQAERVSQGPVTREFEQRLERYLQVPNVIAVSSGSAAVLAALMAVDIKPGDEVIVPNRTWIATAHAVNLLGGQVVAVDVEKDRPVLDVGKVTSAITRRTRAIIAVHMNGRSVDMRRLRALAQSRQLMLIEDAAQALGGRNADGYLGTQSNIGCFSLSVAKTISTGQGGFVVTNDHNIAARLRAIRTHGVTNVKDPSQWGIMGFNFRFTDVLASIGIEQLKRIDERINRLKDLYFLYEDGLRGSPFDVIPVNINGGEVPLYNEFLVHKRQVWVDRLDGVGIETRPFYPSVHSAVYLKVRKGHYRNSEKYASGGIYLPSGPTQSPKNVKYVISEIFKSVK